LPDQDQSVRLDVLWHPYFGGRQKHGILESEGLKARFRPAQLDMDTKEGMRISRRQLIYVRVRQDHFTARVVGGDRTIRRQCHALGNRAGSVRDISAIQPQLKAIFSELKSGFSFFKPWGLLHFDPVEYPVTKQELADFQTAAVRSGVSFCWLSTWEGAHEDKDLLSIFK